MIVKLHRRLVAIACSAVLFGAAAPAPAKEILFVLDSSNSMWGQVDGTAKIETAKSALSTLLSDLPEGTRIGLMVYGHRDKSSCEDVEVVLPLGAANPETVAAAMANVRPTGKTPIAFALEQTPAAFAGAPEETGRDIVLISDGIETCEGAPCEVAGRLAEAGFGVRVHVVGFDISAEDRAALECIAERGGGRYFAADSAEDFRTAVTEAVVVAQADPESEPAEEPEPEPAAEIVFEDDFEGGELAGHWQILAPDPEAFIVEDGALLALGKAQGQLDKPDHPNVFTLELPPPGGDWTLSAVFDGDLQTGREEINLGLYDEPGSAVYARFGTDTGACCIGSSKYSYFWLTVEKFSGGERTHFQSQVGDRVATRDMNFAAFAESSPRPFTLQLVKSGRSYMARLRRAGETDEDGNPKWYETEVVTALRAPKTIALTVGQHDQVKGETVWFIDKITLEKN